MAHILFVLARGIVHTGGRDEIPHLLVKALLRGPDVPDAIQQLAEMRVVAVPVFELVVIHGEALHHVFLEALRGPGPEQGAHRGAHPVAYMQDDIQVVMLCFVTFSISCSY